MQDMVLKKSRPVARDVPVNKPPPAKSADRAGAGEKFFQKKPQAATKKLQSESWSAKAEMGDGSKKRIGWKPIAVFSLIALPLLFFVGLKVFGSVNLEVIPRHESIQVDSTFKASHNEGAQIKLETMRFESELSKKAPVSGTKQVEHPASGRIVIYNAFSSQPQVLVRRTRFETPDGKTFRIKENVTVPGANTSGELKPGLIEAEVVADVPGDGQNIGLTDWTIPGFRGTPRYDKFYARSKTPMAGGFSGVSAVVNQSDLDLLEEAIKAELKENFIARVRQELLPGLIVPENGTIFEIVEVKRSHQAGDPSSELNIAIKASFSAFALNADDVQKSVINKYISATDIENAKIGIIIQNVSSLSYLARNPNFDEQKLDLLIRGAAEAVWQFDHEKLKKDLIAAPSRSRLEVFNRYHEISRAQIIFNPSWWRLFPNDLGKINIFVRGAQ